MENLYRKDWCSIQFDDITLSLKRGPFGSSLKKEFFVPKGYKVYEQQNAIKDDNKIGDYYIDESKYKELEAFSIHIGDYIVSCSGTIGKISRLPEDTEPGIINQALLRIRIDERIIDHRFFQSLFKSMYLQSKILVDSRGTGMNNLAGVKELRRVNLFLPPFPEQRAIVSKIEQLFSDMDNGIDNFKKAQDQLKIYRQAVLKKAFEGELTKKWREKHTDLPSAEELLHLVKEERGKLYQKQMDEWKSAVKDWEANGKEGKKPAKLKKTRELHPFTEEELGELPELPDEWYINKLGFVTIKATKVKKSGMDKNIDFIYLDIGGIDNQINKITSHKLYKWKNAPSRAQQIVHVGDTLFSTVRTYLKNIAMVEKEEFDQQICSSGFTVIRGLQQIIEPKFIFYLCIFEGFIQPLNKFQTGTSYPAVRDDDVFNQPFPICSKAEQYQIVQEIETRLSICDKMEATITESLQKAESLRQSILKKAFEGKLLNEKEMEIARNALDWEPAEKLLEKIKAE